MWMLLNWERIQGKSAIDLDDLTALGSSMMLTSVMLNNLLKTFPVKFKDLELVRGKFAFDGFCKTEFDANTKFIEEKPDAPVSKGLKNLYSGKFTMDDVHWSVFKNKCGMEFIQFEPVLDKETRKNLDDFLVNYSKLYIEDKLKKGKENFYPYIKQFSITFALFKRYIDQYGELHVLSMTKSCKR